MTVVIAGGASREHEGARSIFAVGDARAFVAAPVSI